MPFKGVEGERKNVSQRVTQPNSLPSESESRFTLTPPRRRHNCASLSRRPPVTPTEFQTRTTHFNIKTQTHKKPVPQSKRVCFCGGWHPLSPFRPLSLSLAKRFSYHPTGPLYCIDLFSGTQDSGPFSRRFRDAEPVWCPGGGTPALAPCLRQLFSAQSCEIWNNGLRRLFGCIPRSR